MGYKSVVNEAVVNKGLCQVSEVPEVLKDPDIYAEDLEDPDIYTEVLKDPDIYTEVLEDPDIYTEVLKDPDIYTEVFEDPNIYTEVLKDPDIYTKVLEVPGNYTDTLVDATGYYYNEEVNGGNNDQLTLDLEKISVQYPRTHIVQAHEAVKLCGWDAKARPCEAVNTLLQYQDVDVHGTRERARTMWDTGSNGEASETSPIEINTTWRGLDIPRDDNIIC